MFLQNKACCMTKRHMTYTNIFFPWFSDRKSTTMKRALKVPFAINIERVYYRIAEMLQGKSRSDNVLMRKLDAFKQQVALKRSRTEMSRGSQRCNDTFYPSGKLPCSLLKEPEVLQELLHLSNRVFRTASLESNLASKLQSDCTDLVRK